MFLALKHFPSFRTSLKYLSTRSRRRPIKHKEAFPGEFCKHLVLLYYCKAISLWEKFNLVPSVSLLPTPLERERGREEERRWELGWKKLSPARESHRRNQNKEENGRNAEHETGSPSGVDTRHALLSAIST